MWRPIGFRRSQEAHCSLLLLCPYDEFLICSNLQKSYGFPYFICYNMSYPSTFHRARQILWKANNRVKLKNINLIFLLNFPLLICKHLLLCILRTYRNLNSIIKSQRKSNLSCLIDFNNALFLCPRRKIAFHSMSLDNQI